MRRLPVDWANGGAEEPSGEGTSSLRAPVDSPSQAETPVVVVDSGAVTPVRTMDVLHADAMGPAKPDELSAGTLLGKYRLVRRLGGGGMGSVYEALHTGISKPVALKTMSAPLATDPKAAARFLREAASASRLDHPHVVDVTDFGTDGGVSYLVMELLRGDDLAAVIAREQDRLDPTFVADVMLAVCAGVFAAHESGVVHRDLKPQNIFLARTPLGEMVPKVLDFGISKRLDDDVSSGLTRTGAVMGTTHYLSPEQVAGRPLDVRSDQYALGVIMYEALTGRRPHEGESVYAIMRSIGEGRFTPPREVRPGIPPALEAVLLRAMSTRQQDRFESVHGLGRALLPFASSKRRVIWSDYYERDRPPVSAARGHHVELPLPPVGASRPTVALAVQPAPLERTRTKISGENERPAPAEDGRSEPIPVPVGGTDERLRDELRPRRRRWGLLVAFFAVAAAAAYVVVANPGARERLPEELRTRLSRALSPRTTAASNTTGPPNPQHPVSGAATPSIGARPTSPGTGEPGSPRPAAAVEPANAVAPRVAPQAEATREATGDTDDRSNGHEAADPKPDETAADHAETPRKPAADDKTVAGDGTDSTRAADHAGTPRKPAADDKTAADDVPAAGAGVARSRTVAGAPGATRTARPLRSVEDDDAPEPWWTSSRRPPATQTGRAAVPANKTASPAGRAPASSSKRPAYDPGGAPILD